MRSFPLVTWRDRLRALRVDLTPLRTSRDFRLLFWAGTVFYFGGMVSYVAIPYQIYQLTGSNLAVGAVGLVELVPLIVFGLYGGALADHFDRRLLLIWTGIAQAAFTAWLAITVAAVARPTIGSSAQSGYIRKNGFSIALGLASTSAPCPR